MPNDRTRPTKPPVLAALVLAALCATAAAAPPEQFGVWGARAKPHPYLADPGDEAPPPAGPIQATAQERARGVLIADRPTALAAKDCPGQYGAVTVPVVALEAAEVSVTVTDLSGPGGRRIGAENLDVRAVRFVKVKGKPDPEVIPLLLEKRDRVAAAAGRVQPFRVTYYVPADTPPGLYEGRVRVLAGGAEKLALPLRLTVYPFALVEPDVAFYMYYNSHHAANLAQAEKQLIDQRCHGMNLAPLEMPVTHDGDLVRDAAAAWLDLYAKVGFARKQLHVGLWNRITSEWLNTPDKSIGMWGPWFRYYPFSDRLDRRYVETVRMLRDECRRRGIELVVAVADEPGSHPWTTEATQHYYALLAREVPDVVRELTVGGGWAMKRPEHELWKGLIHIWTTNRWLVDQLALVRQADPKAVIGIYNMGGAGSGPGGVDAARNLYGFFAWKTRAAGVAQWTYYHNGTPEHNYAWPAEDPSEGSVPTVRWEMVREGVKDRRYLATLEGRLAGATGPAADEARKFLADVAAQIDLGNVDYDAISGGRLRVQPPGTYDAWRDRAAEYIVRLGAGGSGQGPR